MPKTRRQKPDRTQISTTDALPPIVHTPPAHDNGDGVTVERALTAGDVPSTTVHAPSLGSLANVLTFQVAAYILLGIIALWLRLVNLDARPLAPNEAQTAAAAWDFINHGTSEPYMSPLLFTLNWLAFFLFGAFDFTARLLPAALGTLVIFIPALARNLLGRLGAILAALLLVFSPSVLFFSRTLSGADLAVGAAIASLILFWQYRQETNTGRLYAAAFFAGLSLTADASAFTVLSAGAIYFGIAWVRSRQAERAGMEKNREEPDQENSLASALQRPFVRAAIIFSAAYILSATTFLINRDGLGVAFNLLGEWINAFAVVGNFASPLNWLVVYEPLPLIFGLAALVLILTWRGEQAANTGFARLLGFVALLAFVWYTIAGNKNPSVIVAVAMPLILLAGWFIASLIERAHDDIVETGGFKTMLAGEIPIFALLLIFAALVYLQVVTFLQQTRFSPALDVLYQALSVNSPDASLMAAGITLAIVSVLLLGTFIGLSILLVGVARTTSLLACTILLLLAFGTLRAAWFLNFSDSEPVRELAAPIQTPLQIRDLVRDLEFYSEARLGDTHVIRIAADPQLGAVGRWYLRAFPNVTWSSDLVTTQTAEAIVTPALTPPPGNWMGQQYRIGVTWTPEKFDGLGLWKWYMMREGGADAWQTTMMWLPTQE